MFAHVLADGAVLRPLEPWRAAEFAAVVDQARDYLRPWIPFASRVVDEDTARELLQRYADLQARDAGAMFGIWIDNKLSGGTLFRSFDASIGVAEVGVWLAPEAAGRGLIQAAVGHMLDYAFRERGLSRVEWFCSPVNERSQAAARRLGMTYEGTLRSSFLVEGRRQDSQCWAVLAEEWLSVERP